MVQLGLAIGHLELEGFEVIHLGYLFPFWDTIVSLKNWPERSVSVSFLKF